MRAMSCESRNSAARTFSCERGFSGVTGVVGDDIIFSPGHHNKSWQQSPSLESVIDLGLRLTLGSVLFRGVEPGFDPALAGLT